MFFLSSFECTFAVARIFGRCVAISSAIRPGHVEKFSLLIAVINVLGTGQNTAQ